MASQVKFPPAEDNKDAFGASLPQIEEESASSKFWRKMKEQPLVPVGECVCVRAFVCFLVKD